MQMAPQTSENKNKFKALVTAELLFDNLKIFEKVIDFEFSGYGNRHSMLPPEELKEKCKDIDILITEFDTINENIINSAQKLKLIICCRSGVTTVVDLDATRKKGIMVCNNVGRNKVATSEFTIGLIIDLLRNISKTNRLIHERILTSYQSNMPKEYKDSLWGLNATSPYVTYRGPSFSEVILGIIGYGCVGQMVAKKAEDLGMKVIIANHTSIKDKEIRYGKVVDQDELLQTADVISIHASGNANKVPLISEREFQLMKKTAYLVNTARGYLVDENALVDALNTGKIQGAALDVTINEPLPPTSQLLGVPNLILTPHIAGSSSDTQFTGTKMVIETLKDYLCGIKPEHCID